MVREIKTKIYKLNELSNKAREKAIENHRSILVDFDDWFEPVIEDFQTKMEEAGHNIDIETISFGDFYSQGAGACFTTENGELDIRSLLKDLKIKMKDLPSGFSKELKEGLMTIELNQISYHHSHPFTIEPELIYDGENSKIEDVFLRLQPLFINILRGKMTKLNNELQRSYEACLREDNVIEEINSQGLEFYEDGEDYSE